MFQYVGILLAVLGLGRAQTLPTLPYFQNLDGDGDFVINWGLTNDSITIELIVYTTGWVGLGLLSDDSTMIDYWWGGFDEDFGIDYIQDAYSSFSNLQVGPRFPDTLNNLNVIYINQPPFVGSTRVRFSRPFQTGDYKQDVDILPNVRQFVIWAYAESDAASSPAFRNGISQVVFRPAT